MFPVPVPDASLIEGWQASLGQRVQQGEITDAIRKSYEWGFAQFMDWLGHAGEQTISDEVIEKWAAILQEQGYNSFSVSFWLTCVQDFFAWAFVEGGSRNGTTLSPGISQNQVSQPSPEYPSGC